MYLSKSELESIQQDFQASITQNSSEIRMDFTAITNEIINNVSANQTLLEEYIRFKGALIELGKVGMRSRRSFPTRSWPLRRTDRRLPIFPIRAL